MVLFTFSLIERGIGRIITFMLSSLRVFYVKLMLVNRVFDWLWRARSTTLSDSRQPATMHAAVR